MSHALRFQVLILPNAPWAEVMSRFRHVEDLGFDLATTADHFVDWNNPAVPWLEAWTVLAAAARETTRIRLATYVSQIPLRHPAMLARQALTVDHISGGRLEVGLGTGLSIDPAYDMIGIPNWEPKERVARFAEYVEIVDRLLSNEKSSFEGRYYRVKDAAMNPRPVQRPRPPIVIAALGPVMLRLAARHADNWNTLSFAPSFDRQLAETSERIAPDRRRLRRHRARPGVAPALLPDVRPGVAGHRRAHRVLRVRGPVRRHGGPHQGARRLRARPLLPHPRGARPTFEKIARDVIPKMKG